MSITETTTAPSGPPPVATTHDHHGVIVTSIERPQAELVASCRARYTGLLLDHLGKQGCMTPDMKPVWSGATLCGPAVTVLGADWRIRSAAADLAEPGDVIVVAAGGVECAVLAPAGQVWDGLAGDVQAEAAERLRLVLASGYESIREITDSDRLPRA